MCNFFSCIVTKTGHVLYDPMSDSHEDIIDKYKEQHDLTDDTTDPEKLRFARVEITPPNIDVFAPVDQWVLTIDQRITPAWWSEVFVQTAMICLSEFLSTAILVGKEISELTSGRFWARDCRIDKLTGTALVVRLESSQVREMLGSSQVGVMRESSQVGVHSSEVNYVLNDNAIAIINITQTPKIITVNEKIQIELQEGKRGIS